jgi:hypothetical protein
MASKENKGGFLKNDQIEQDLKAKGKASEGNEAYIGSQDIGDSEVRHLGNDVQQRDGLPSNEESGEH